MTVHVIEVPRPGPPHEPASPELLASAAVERAAQTATWGFPDFAETASEIAAWLRRQEHEERHRYLAVVEADGARTPAGAAHLALPGGDNAELAVCWVAVHPEYRRRGVGSHLLEHVLAVSRAAARTLVHSWTDHAHEPPAHPEETQALVPPTGEGRLPRDASSAFATAHGFELGQVERHSVLTLPADAGLLDRLEADAAAHAAGYRVVTWTDAAPSRWLDDYALLTTRMSTDVPLGTLELHEDAFDAARMRALEREHAEAGHRLLVSAAEHVGSGALAAFTVLVADEGERPSVFQDATLALAEHRGHRLGLLVKIANLRLLARTVPAAPRVHTWNAEENQHMLAVNVALGFTRGGVQGQWQRHLG